MSNAFSLSKLSRLFKNTLAGRVPYIDADGNPSTALLTQPTSLTNLIYPSQDGGWRDVYRSGWLPSWFNQQWGGAQWGGLPDGSNGDVATGNAQDDNVQYLGSGTSVASLAAGFILSESMTSSNIWIKLYKIGNPVDNISVSVYSNTTGTIPLSLIGSGSPIISGKIVTSKADGEWYKFEVPHGTLTPNTQYHVAIQRSGAADASNYYAVKKTNSTKYPFGYFSYLNISTWTPVSTQQLCFLIQNPSTNKFLSSGGQFDSKLNFLNGTPINQSKSLTQPLSNFYDGKSCTVAYRGTYTASSNVFDFLYGLDHDRFTVTINSSGYPILSLYDTSGTLYQVTSTVDVTSGFHDIGVAIRTHGDGADYMKLYVDGVSVGTPLLAQTLVMSNDMKQLGTARLGDGFGIIPTWTVNTDMSVLPSAAGWTYTGTASEANAMSVSGGKLYQNANGAVSQNAYYSRTTTLNNSTGWLISIKTRNANCTNAYPPAGAHFLSIQDGTKSIGIYIAEYFFTTNGSSVDFVVQSDLKSSERIINVCGKGSDYYVFLDGKLVVDGTGKLINSNASNSVTFGDGSAAGYADAIYDYVKIYNGGMLLPTASSNTCSEFAHWSGDKSSLLPLAYNNGTPVSIKQLCGVSKNYVGEGAVFSEKRKGVSLGITYTTLTQNPDLQAFAIGSTVKVSAKAALYNTTVTNYVFLYDYLDGIRQRFIAEHNPAAINSPVVMVCENEDSVYCGLHKIDARMSANSGTGSDHSAEFRAIDITSKP